MKMSDISTLIAFENRENKGIERWNLPTHPNLSFTGSGLLSNRFDFI